MYCSKKFISYLDSYDSSKQLDFTECKHLMNEIGRNYTSLTNDYNYLKKTYKNNKNYTRTNVINLTNDIITMIEEENNKNNINEDKPKIKKNIDIKISTISDLLNIIKDNEYDEAYEYNIDLKALHNIKDELIQINDMIGLNNLKQSILDQLLYFIQKLHIIDKNNSDYKHTVIYGLPGTGKTEVAKILGSMYSKVGLLTNNVFKKVTRSDLIAGYLGQTAIKTKKVLDDCLGGVLFIDEAYSLAAPDSSDSFSKECLDTLCEALSDNKNDLMVIVAGYEEELNNTFFKVNKGLDSRFIWRFYMKPYSPKELMQIFYKKVNDSLWKTDIDESELISWFTKNFSSFKNNGRDMELLFTYVKVSHSKRIYGCDPELRKKINMTDISKAFNVFLDNKKNDKESISHQHIYI
jgi:SpoVK/Ycf46/Vps4 family AAA+-type ATPase